MGGLLFTGGTIVTADGSFEADVLVEDEKIVAVGTEIAANGTETVDASGKLIMPGFIDAHTHMAMPFGGTVTADDWATGTAAAAAGGTTTIIDFALQEEGGTLAGAVEAWTEKARDKALTDYGFHVAITDLRDDVKTELPTLATRGVIPSQIKPSTPRLVASHAIQATMSTAARGMGHARRQSWPGTTIRSPMNVATGGA